MKNKRFFLLNKMPTRVQLCGGDGPIFDMDDKYIDMCVTLKSLVDDMGDLDPETKGQLVIPIQCEECTPEIFKKVLEFCELHHGDQEDITEEKLRERPPYEGKDKEFMDVELKVKYMMILTANYLDCKTMLDFCCKDVADMIKQRSPEEIKAIFGIEGEYTEADKEAVYKEHPWLREEAEEHPLKEDPPPQE